jgi:hypothetical protein
MTETTKRAKMNTGLKGYNNAPGMKTKKGPPYLGAYQGQEILLERV